MGQVFLDDFQWQSCKTIFELIFGTWGFFFDFLHLTFSLFLKIRRNFFLVLFVWTAALDNYRGTRFLSWKNHQFFVDQFVLEKTAKSHWCFRFEKEVYVREVTLVSFFHEMWEVFSQAALAPVTASGQKPTVIVVGI